jgi:hypothetical protein
MTAPVLAAAALALAAPVAPATAATLEPLKPCYVTAGEVPRERENLRLVGDAFAPDSTVDIFVDGQLVTTTRTDPVGAFSGEIDAPYQGIGERTFTLAVSDPVGNVVTTAAQVTALDVTLFPRQARASSRVRFRGRGYTGPDPVYAHYVYGGEVRKTVQLGEATAPCGTFEVRRRQIPFRRPRVGEWTLQVDQQRRYSPHPASNYVRVPLTVRRVFRPPDD